MLCWTVNVFAILILQFICYLIDNDISSQGCPASNGRIISEQ
jgi:hypothetical protein